MDKLIKANGSMAKNMAMENGSLYVEIDILANGKMELSRVKVFILLQMVLIF